jgi:protein N-lysine methyltransferase METTL21D
MLSVVLGPLVRSFIATDIPELVSLIRKNIALNASAINARTKTGSPSTNIVANDLDWTFVHQTPRSKWPSLRLLPLPSDTEEDKSSSSLDLVLVVDCVYHPSLIPPLISTLDYLASNSSSLATISSNSPPTDRYRIGPQVLVVVELRAEDVIREFLNAWLAMDDWEIWSLNTGEGDVDDSEDPHIPAQHLSSEDTTKEGIMHPRYGVWVGWKVKHGP